MTLRIRQAHFLHEVVILSLLLASPEDWAHPHRSTSFSSPILCASEKQAKKQQFPIRFRYPSSARHDYEMGGAGGAGLWAVSRDHTRTRVY